MGGWLHSRPQARSWASRELRSSGSCPHQLLRIIAAALLLTTVAAPSWARHHRRKHAEPSQQKTEEKSADKATEKASDKAADKAADKTTDKRAHKGAVVVVTQDFEPPPAGEQSPPGPAGSLSPLEAMAKLEAAYQKSHAPQLLFQLGVILQTQGKTVEAQDFMRRYLADPLIGVASTAGEAASAQDRATAEQILALPRLPSGDVHVIADHEGLVYVDDRLVGTWPLPLPLLVPVGQHVVAIQVRGHKLQGKLEVIDGRGAEIRFNRTTSSVVVTMPPAVLVLDEVTLSAAHRDVHRKTAQLIDRAIQEARLSVYSKEAALAKQPTLRACVKEPRCQEELAQKSDAEYALRIVLRENQQTLAPPNTLSATLSVSLLDVETGNIAASEDQSCTACAPPDLLSTIAKTLQAVLRAGPNRPRGSLSVNSTPPDAEILLGTRVLGKTPYKRAALSGTYELSIRHAGYATQTIAAVVSTGKTEELAVTLTAQAPLLSEIATSPKTGRLPRPRWRLITGGVLLGSGIILSGIGISGMYEDGRCVVPPQSPALSCRDRFDTLTPGGAVFGVGAALSIAGAVLLGVPGPRIVKSP